MSDFGWNKAIQRMYGTPTPDENKTEDNIKAVPVKVRLSVTESEVSRAVYGVKEDYITPGVKAVMDMCLKNAVIDVPSGVPSLQNIHELYWLEREGVSQGLHVMSGTEANAYAAIRDRILAGLIKEEMEEKISKKIECIFCDYVATNLNDLKEHSAKCEKHPLWKEIIKLKNELDERCQQLANYDYEHWDDIRDANTLIDTVKQFVPEKAAGWCYDCSTVVETYHYGGSGNPQCCKCRSSKTDDLSCTMDEYVTKLQSILYKKET